MYKIDQIEKFNDKKAAETAAIIKFPTASD